MTFENIFSTFPRTDACFIKKTVLNATKLSNESSSLEVAPLGALNDANSTKISCQKGENSI